MNNEYPRDVNCHTFEVVTKLMNLAESGRAMIDVALKLAGGDKPDGACLHASIMSCELLRNWSDYQAVIRGGGGGNDGGYEDENGELHGHYWVEVSTPGGTFIFDLTADQFPGGKPISIYHIEEPPAKRWVPGNQRVVNAHIEIIKEEMRGIRLCDEPATAETK